MNKSNELINIQPEEVLVREGEDSHVLFYLNTGSLAIFKRKGTVEQQIGTIYAGELVGEMSFLDKQPRSATVKAITECELVVIKGEKLEELLDKLPKWYRVLLVTLCERLRKANARIKI
jgi:CRP/FNR family cyclic AMP-dependent transcriptional regulator